MKNLLIITGLLLVGILGMSACSRIITSSEITNATNSVDAVNEPIETVETLPAAVTEVPQANVDTQLTQAPEALPQFSFEAVEYLDEDAGVVLYHPADWSLLPREQVGDRGSQAVLHSPGSTLEKIAEGGSRISLVVYRWDPTNDLSAYISQRELAWEASGFEFTRMEDFSLEDGRQMVIFSLTTTDGLEFLTALTTTGDNYLQIAGEGNVDLCLEIIRSVRSIN